MNSNELKNIVVLKDLPSNLIDEAFIILKNNKKIKTISRVEKISNESENMNKQDEYIIKEAEMVIGNYLSKLEKDKQMKTYAVRQMETKCKRLKIITIILSCILLIEVIINLF